MSNYNKKAAAPAKKPKKYGDERDYTYAADGKVPCTMPPRTRDGADYPGRRHNRKAMATLGLRMKTFIPNMPNVKGTKCTKPGSMKR